MLEILDVTAGYGSIHALKGICMRVSKGEIVALIGANGAGKTTLLMTISGIISVQSGEIRFLGRSIHRFKPNAIVQSGISQVPEGRRIFPFLTVMENLAMGAFLRKDMHAVRQDLELVFDLFPILSKRKNASGAALSGGEQQMLAISRAIMARPRLLLLDEPSLGLALKLAHRGIVMENGQITLSGPSSKLLSDDAVKKAYLGM
jgi:branched-chain amino acid transport system ATP-binding protein